MKSHLIKRAIHNDLVKQVSSLNVIELAEVCLTCDLLAFEEVVDAVHVTCLEGGGEKLERHAVLHNASQHLLQ